ncbi:MAG: hypothetical protein N2512_09940, partial [Armatimonadetes bacterium]|nr:hypothetical protein [Armatimonadota bacterium]
CWGPSLVIAVGVVLVLFQAAITVELADTVYDEGGYLYEGWAVASRGWVPYRDFHTKVTPLVYYFYGVPQAIIGPGVRVGRWQAVVTSLAALAICCVALRRRYGPWAAALVVWGFAAVPAGLDQHFRALAIAPVALWMSLGLLGIAVQPRFWGTVLAGCAAGLVFLTRQDLLGPAAALVVGAGLASGRWRASVSAAIFGALVALLGLAPFLLRPSPQLFSALSLGLVSAGPALGVGPFARTEPLTLGNLPWYVVFLARAYVAPLLLLLPGVAALVTTKAGLVARRHPLIFTGALAAALNLVVRGTGAALTGANAFYLRDFYIEVPLLTAAAGVLVAGWRAAGEHRHRRLLEVLALAAVVLGPVVNGLPKTVRFQRPTVLEGIEAAGRFIAANTGPADRVFAIDDPHIFLQAGRELLPMLAHHLFLYQPSVPTELLRGTHSFNLEMLVDALRREATVAVITERGMSWVRNNERTREGQAVAAAVARELSAGWRLVAREGNAFAGVISIYRRKGDQRGGIGTSEEVTRGFRRG